MTAAILSIGTELTRGEVHNTNATWLGEAISSLGMTVQSIHTIPDDGALIQQTLRRLADEVAVVVCTGGLGPTSDDMTAREVALLLDVPLQRDSESYRALEARLNRAGRPMTASNAKQADLPAGCEVLPNEEGTAPGFALPIGAAQAFFLPGVPREMRAMFQRFVKPEVQRRLSRVTWQTRLMTYGLPESDVNERLRGLEQQLGVTLGYRARFPEIEVKLQLAAEVGHDPRAQLRAAVVEVRRRLGDAVYTDGDETFAEAAARPLRQRGWWLGLAESCTGGLLSQMITERPASDYFRGAVVCYDNAIKRGILGVPETVLSTYGAVSDATVRAMAEGARRVLACDVSLSISGVAGPGGGTEDKPVGLVHFGLSTATHTVSEQHIFSGDREQVRIRAAYHSLMLLRRHLGELEAPQSR